MVMEEITKLKELDLIKQIAFAYLTCERLYPNYIYFSDHFRFGNPSTIRDAIDYLYLNLFEANPDKTKIDFHIENIDKNTPDTEDFTTIFVSSALDVCAAISDSLGFLVSKDFSKITDISSYSFDSIDMYIREIENIESSDKNFRQRIIDHPLMKKEMLIQLGIITFLCNTPSIDYGDLQTLLNLQENNQKGNLDL